MSLKRKKSKTQLNRRQVLASSMGAAAIGALPRIALQTGGRRVLTLQYDKVLGAMRAIERVIP